MLLITIATKSLSSLAGGLIHVAAKAVAAARFVIRAVHHRRDVLRLSELDERGLKDIGLVRSDVEGALATSWLSDPSSVLAAQSEARNGVAKARREEGLRRAELKRPDEAPVACRTSVACNA